MGDQRAKSKDAYPSSYELGNDVANQPLVECKVAPMVADATGAALKTELDAYECSYPGD